MKKNKKSKPPNCTIIVLHNDGKTKLITYFYLTIRFPTVGWKKGEGGKENTRRPFVFLPCYLIVCIQQLYN